MPSSKNYRRDYKQEAKYESSDVQKKRRAARNKARREAIAAGKVKKGDGKDIDHIVPLSKGGSTSSSNTRVKTASSNRSYARTKSGKIK